MRISSDDRRLLYADVFETPDNDVNIAIIYPTALSAWHRHQRQDDKFFVVSGTLKVGVVGPSGDTVWHILSERQPGPLTIIRNHWHGYMNIGSDNAIVIMYLNKYDPTDEEREPAAPKEWERIIR